MSTRQLLPIAGGTITITPGPNNSYQLRYEFGSGPGGLALYQLAISRQGRPLAVVPATGIGPMPPYPQPSVLTYIISDSQGMWGRICPQCRSYFRTNHVMGMIICPYCTFAHESIYFMTDSQLEYVKKYVDTVELVVKEQRAIAIDLREATDSPEWTYDERQLQHRFTCTACDVNTDILGEYGSCPKCGKRNSGMVFHRKLNDIETQVQGADTEQLASLLNRAVSEFEAMANDLKRILVSIPCHPNRRDQIARLSFQDVALSVEQFRQWYGFELARGIAADDLGFADLMFKRRHLFTHTAGRVDEKYLAETGDRTVELNELVILNRDELERLLPLVRRLGTNLISSVDALE